MAWQAAEQLVQQALGLRTVDGAHYADLGLAQQQVARHKLRHGRGVDAAQTGLVNLCAIGMVAKHRLIECLGRLCSRFGVGFADGGHPTLTLALPDIARETGRGQLSCRQSHSGIKQLGAGEAAQRKTHAVNAGIGVDHGAQIGPCFA